MSQNYWCTGGIVLLLLSCWLSIVSPTKQGKSLDDVYDMNKGLPKDTPEDQIDLNRYRLNEEKHSYFKLGENHSCGKNMRFFAVPKNLKNGQCDCDWFDCSRPLLYHEFSKQCYWAWSRGPCRANEWYVYGKGMFPVCKRRPCPTVQDEADGASNFYFERPEDGKCYEAGTRGYCKYESERLWIYPNQPIPQCRNFTLCYPLSIPVEQICIQGSRFAHKNSECAF